MNRFSPSDAALEGFRLTRERPGTILAWSGIYLVGLMIIAIAMMVTLGPQFIALAQKGGPTAEDAEEVAAMLAQSWPAFIVVMLMTVLLISVILGGIYRIVLRPEERGFAYLRLGKDELRLAAVNLVLFVIGMGFLLFGLMVTATAAQFGQAVAWVAAAALAALTIWVGVRLSLVTPATFAQRRIAIRPAWELTRGRFWPLLGMIVLAVIFYLMIWVLISIIAIAVVELAGGREAVQDFGAMTATTAIAAMATMVMQLLLQILQIVMIYAPFSVAYQKLAGASSAEA